MCQSGIHFLCEIFFFRNWWRFFIANLEPFRVFYETFLHALNFFFFSNRLFSSSLIGFSSSLQHFFVLRFYSFLSLISSQPTDVEIGHQTEPNWLPLMSAFNEISQSLLKPVNYCRIVTALFRAFNSLSPGSFLGRGPKKTVSLTTQI